MQKRSGFQDCSSQQNYATKQFTERRVISTGYTIQRGKSRASRESMSALQVYPQVGASFWAQLLLFGCLVSPAWSQLTEEQQDSIVKLHNYYRRQTEPSAANMRSMRWDPSLMLQAEGYAVKCMWAHNPDLKNLNIGENLFAMVGHLDPSKALEQWFMEHKSFNYDNNSCTEDMMCGHYTQMVWAESYLVGCSLHHCDTMEGLSFQKADFLICNYFPMGNYEGEKPYETGELCSNCPEHARRCDMNLCEYEEGEDDEEENKEKTQSPNTSPGTYIANHVSHPSVQQTTTLTTPPGLDMTYPSNVPPYDQVEETKDIQQRTKLVAAGSISKTSSILVPILSLLNFFLRM